MIDVRNLSYSYSLGTETVSVLSEVNLSVKAGDFVAIQGPSGSGKSTLLYLLGGLLKIQSGTCRVANQSLEKMNSDELARFRLTDLGFVFQHFHLLPRATVLDNVMLPSQYLGEPEPSVKERAFALLRTFGLEDRLNHHPNQLSGGQQQRVAIARALINQPKLLLADEPTGNLDSRSAHSLMEVLSELNQMGTTIVMITHEQDVAAYAKRTVRIKDGKLDQDETSLNSTENPSLRPHSRKLTKRLVTSGILKTLLLQSLANLKRNRLRSALTMIGVLIGVSALVSMITLGQFTKDRILESYMELGVNTIVFYGHPNWEIKATDRVPVMYTAFDWDRDLSRLGETFPEILRISPIISSWRSSVAYGGRTVDQEIRTLGVNESALSMTTRELAAGSNFNSFHIETKSPVCLLGYELARELLRSVDPIGQVIQVKPDEASIECRVLGVLQKTQSHNEWMNPNYNVFLPYTTLQTLLNPWQRGIRRVMIQVDPTGNIEETGNKIRAFFGLKYGASGNFRVDSDSILMAQMEKFLTLFTILLGVIASVSLAVGGIGIANMMLASVTERLREIGIRKAVGASDTVIRTQFLVETVLICTCAGVIGVAVGVGIYEGLIYGATYFVKNLEFVWIFDPWALGLGLVSTLGVGVASGIFPALKAERLQVVDALRSE